MDSLSSKLQSEESKSQQNQIEKTDMQKLLFFQLYDLNEKKNFISHEINSATSSQKDSLSK